MNFKIFPSGVAVLPSAINGIDITSVACDKFNVTVQTSSHIYLADTFDNRNDAEKYVAELVAELQCDEIAEPIAVSQKDFTDDDFIIKDINGDVLNANHFAIVWRDLSKIYAIDYVNYTPAKLIKIDTRGQDSETVFKSILKQSEELELIKDAFDVAVSNLVRAVSVCANTDGWVYLNYNCILVPLCGFDDYKSAEKYCEELQEKYEWN